MAYASVARILTALGSDESLQSKRRAWAQDIRRPVYDHPKQLAFCVDPSPYKVVAKNRRAGGTEGQGRWDLSDLVERDNLLIWVYSIHLAEYSRNWLQRQGAPSAIDILQSAGLRMGTDFSVLRKDKDTILSISFPWGSHLLVLPAGDVGKVQVSRGGAPDRVRLDEVQEMRVIAEIIREVVGAAGADKQAEVSMSGTPGKEIGTYFWAAVTGQDSSWSVHTFYSVDNPFFGSTWNDRYRRAVHDRITQLAGLYNLSDFCGQMLSSMTEDRFHRISSLPTQELSADEQRFVRELHDDALREFFGRWVVESSDYVYGSFSSTPPDTLYWGEWSCDLNVGNTTGWDSVGPMLDAPDRWYGRISTLPAISTSIGAASKKWRAVLSADLGYNPDPFALVVWLWSPQHGSLIEFDSAKSTRLTEPEQLSVISSWAKRLTSMGIPVSALVVDASGGEATAVSRGWSDKLAYVVPNVVEAHKPNKWTQIWQMNSEIRSGKIQMLRNSPLSVEGRYLKKKQRDLDKQYRLEVDKYREVHSGGLKFRPGDNCLDAARYGWFYCTHQLSTHISDMSSTPLSSSHMLYQKEIG